MNPKVLDVRVQQNQETGEMELVGADHLPPEVKNHLLEHVKKVNEAMDSKVVKLPPDERIEELEKVLSFSTQRLARVCALFHAMGVNIHDPAIPKEAKEAVIDIACIGQVLACVGMGWKFSDAMEYVEDHLKELQKTVENNPSKPVYTMVDEDGNELVSSDKVIHFIQPPPGGRPN